MLEFMDARTSRAHAIVDLYMQELFNPERLERMNARDIAVAMAVVIDKFTGVKAQSSSGVKIVIEGKIEDLSERTKDD